ncbi:MAG: hypothetical protein PHU53_02705 [Thermoplasmata archaeon]|nr:hypothetical protein [Thermoplasmata archaeon]
MDAKGYREFCARDERVRKGLKKSEIDANLKIAREFENSLKGRDFSKATKRDLERFAKLLVREKRNDWESFVGLIRYSRFVENEDVEIAVLILVDGLDVLETLSETIKKELGPEKQDRIFKGVEKPSIGTSTKNLPKTAAKFLRNLQAEEGLEGSRKLLQTGPHAGPKENHAHHREMYLAAGSVDGYLEARRNKFVAMLEKHAKEGTLFYNQRIDEDVMDFVRRTPELEGGQRKGRIIYVTKIPYMAIEYLKEKDPKMKRYYACHCPWARETILTGKELDPEFCHCSAGFSKKPLDVAFNADLKIEVLESALAGNDRCRFAVHLPKGLK